MKKKPKPNDIDAVIGKNLKTLRKIKGLSQASLAEGLDITFQQVQKYEQVKNRLSASRLYQASQLLECDILSFYQGLEGRLPHHDNNALRELKDADDVTIKIISLLNSIEDPGVKQKLLSFLKSLSLNKKY